MIIAVDFDGTIVFHEFPKVGAPVPGAIEWLLKFQEAGAKLILWTMRSDGPQEDRHVLLDAVNYCLGRGLNFWGINENPDQKEWTCSPKAYAHVYIDDAAFGCPLVAYKMPDFRPHVDWDIVGPKVMEIIKANE